MTIIGVEFPEREYRRVVTAKDLIVLHHTVSSNAMSTINWWKADNGARKTATSFVVEKNGDIYQCFSAEYWAVHLYIHKEKGLEPPQLYRDEKRSIGIEIVNEGPLTRKFMNGKLVYRWNEGKSIYRGAVKETVKDYRGFGNFWADFTEEQYTSVAMLLKLLKHQFGIPLHFVTSKDVMDLSKFKGVAAHRNLRKDKSDVSPIWDWNKLEKLCLASE